MTTRYDTGKYCVHGGSVRSIWDGDFHFIPAYRVAELYGLRRHEWREGVSMDAHPSSLKWQDHRWSVNCLGPDEYGDYRLPPTSTVTTGFRPR